MTMAQRTNDQSNGRLFTWGGLALAGAVAAVGLPKLAAASRTAARSVGGMTYKSGGAKGSARPAADPARGIPA